MSSDNAPQDPYVGPRAFKEGEPIFGRSREELQLFQLLVARRIALLHSPSGAGKTSLIQAGLIPRLKADGFNVLPIARLNEKPPDSPPHGNGFNRYVYSLLLSLQEGREDRLDGQLASQSLSSYLEADYLKESDSELAVLIVDQFEEILTVDPTDIDQKSVFFAQIGQALRNPNLWALFAIREDYLGALEPYVRAIPTRLANTLRLDLLGTAAASEAISKPADAQGVQFSDRAVKALVDDLRLIQVQQPDGKVVEQPGPYVEPVQLQVVCQRLWQELSPGQTEITEEDLKEVGNVDESLAAYYAERVSAIEADPESSASERDVRRWVHDNLITKDDIRVPVLKGQEQTGGLDNRAIGMLEDAHLVRADKRAGMIWYELAHDRLVRPVRYDNVNWFNEHLTMLQRQAQRWQEEGGPDYLLLREQSLEEAEAWAKRNSDELSEDDIALLEASRKEQKVRNAEATRRRLIRNMVIVAGLLFLILIMVVAVFVARDARNRATLTANRATTDALLAYASVIEADARAAEAEVIAGAANQTAEAVKAGAAIDAANATAIAANATVSELTLAQDTPAIAETVLSLNATADAANSNVTTAVANSTATIESANATAEAANAAATSAASSLILLDVPYLSQWDETASTHIADGGVTALAMIINAFFAPAEPVTVDMLYARHLPDKAPSEFTNISEIVKIGSEVGLDLTFDRYQNEKEALEGLREMVREGKPVIILVNYAAWDRVAQNNFGGGAFVLVTGFDDQNVFVHDPLFRSTRRGQGEYFVWSNELFLTGWGTGHMVGNPDFAYLAPEKGLDR